MTEPGEITYKRRTRTHVFRWLMFIFLAGLNIAMIMSFLERLYKHVPMQVGPELVQFLFLIACDMYFLPTAIFEVNYVTLCGEELTVATLLWKSKLARKDIVSFVAPRWLTWGLLRTPRCFYLINRADIPNFDELADNIEQKLLKQDPSSGANGLKSD